MKRIPWLTSLLVLFLLHLALMNNANSQESSYMVGNEKKFIGWERFDKALVEVEGLAWGAFHKGLGEHLVLAQDDKVYLENIDLAKTDLNGRLISIVGTLRKQRMEKAPPGAQGYGQDFDYYSIDVIAVRRIEKVEQYQILPPRNEWIVLGMPAAEALQKVQARQWPIYHRSQAVSGATNTKLHAFQINAQRVLDLAEKDGKITYISETQLISNGTIYPSEKSINLRGFELPSSKVMSK